jgi:hypothetical protein
MNTALSFRRKINGNGVVLPSSCRPHRATVLPTSPSTRDDLAFNRELSGHHEHRVLIPPQNINGNGVVLPSSCRPHRATVLPTSPSTRDDLAFNKRMHHLF